MPKSLNWRLCGGNSGALSHTHVLHVLKLKEHFICLWIKIMLKLISEAWEEPQLQRLQLVFTLTNCGHLTEPVTTKSLWERCELPKGLVVVESTFSLEGPNTLPMREPTGTCVPSLGAACECWAWARCAVPAPKPIPTSSCLAVCRLGRDRDTQQVEGSLQCFIHILLIFAGPEYFCLVSLFITCDQSRVSAGL